MITLRRIGHSAREIRDYINLYDTDSLLGEYAELLLKFVPNKRGGKNAQPFIIEASKKKH